MNIQNQVSKTPDFSSRSTRPQHVEKSNPAPIVQKTQSVSSGKNISNPSNDLKISSGNQKNETENQKVKDFFASKNIDLQFTTDPDTGSQVIKFLDSKNNGEVIKQIPSEEMLKISKHIDEFLQRADTGTKTPPQNMGVLLNIKA